MAVEVVGKISDIHVIASGDGVRRAAYLRRRYGGLRWRKLTGIADRLSNHRIRRAEIHWYESHGVGNKGMKIKRFVD